MLYCRAGAGQCNNGWLCIYYVSVGIHSIRIKYLKYHSGCLDDITDTSRIRILRCFIIIICETRTYGVHFVEDGSSGRVPSVFCHVPETIVAQNPVIASRRR